ncbi:MAG: UDP-2,3-diacylglucosamine diphosphatase, partial [Caldimonas sp.]
AFVAPASWRAIDFISDLHLADDTPKTFDVWAHYLRHTDADAVLILGDLFEVWVGDDARAEGFEARGAAVLADAASRRTIGFMVGNRDFLLGAAMLEACGVTALADPTVVSAFGERMVLSHGDALCVGDVAYQQFREIVRGAAWQRDFLARPMAERRALAREMRAESERRKGTAGPWFDVDFATAIEALRSADSPALIHGHTHRPGSETLAPGYSRHVLTDWDFDHGSVPRAEVLRWRATGLTRITPDEAVRGPS